jgi:SPP1 gp7 family putative phage head morphogenesis protein
MPTPQKIGGPLSPAHEVALRRALAPLIQQAQATAARVTTPGQARALGAALRLAWPDARLRELVAKAGRTVEGQASKAWPRTDAPTRQAYDPRALVDAWSREAAAKISSVRDEVAEGLRREIVAALEKGTDPAELAERWRVRGLPVAFGTLEGRVKVIANHQLSILHSRVQRERARALGVTHFLWRTQGDARVRERHQALDGQRVAYADGAPGEGLPGEPVNCRCWAQSIVDASKGPSVGKASAGSSTRQTAAVERAQARVAVRVGGPAPVGTGRALGTRRR